jgi:16S rRNA G966 N2-methylase RsmD
LRLIKLDSIIRSLNKIGLRQTIKNYLSYVIDYFFDLKYKTDTSSWVTLDDLNIDDSAKKRASGYQPTHAFQLRKLLRTLSIPINKVMIDLGSGKGKVLLIASEFGFREARGIEISRRLCNIAINNCHIYKQLTNNETNFVVINSDVINYNMRDDEDVFYMFNPFDEYVLKQMMKNISESILRQNRKIWIIYRNAIYKDIIDTNKYFTKITDFISLGQEYAVYTNRGDV